MTRPRRTFRDWEREMSQKLLDVQKATETIYHVLLGTPLRQTAEEKAAAIEGLSALERQLRGELQSARRKHIERKKTLCQACGEYRAQWRAWDGVYLCTKCACERHSIVAHTPRCEYCDKELYGWTDVQRNDRTGELYCSPQCALKARGCESMISEEEDGR